MTPLFGTTDCSSWKFTRADLGHERGRKRKQRKRRPNLRFGPWPLSTHVYCTVERRGSYYSTPTLIESGSKRRGTVASAPVMHVESIYADPLRVTAPSRGHTPAGTRPRAFRATFGPLSLSRPQDGRTWGLASENGVNYVFTSLLKSTQAWALVLDSVET